MFHTFSKRTVSENDSKNLSTFVFNSVIMRDGLNGQTQTANATPVAEFQIVESSLVASPISPPLWLLMIDLIAARSPRESS